MQKDRLDKFEKLSGIGYTHTHTHYSHHPLPGKRMLRRAGGSEGLGSAGGRGLKAAGEVSPVERPVKPGMQPRGKTLHGETQGLILSSTVNERVRAEDWQSGSGQSLLRTSPGHNVTSLESCPFISKWWCGVGST